MDKYPGKIAALVLTLVAAVSLLSLSSVSACGGMGCLGIQPNYCDAGLYQCIVVCGLTIYAPAASEIIGVAVILSNPITMMSVGPIVLAALAAGGFITLQTGVDC